MNEASSHAESAHRRLALMRPREVAEMLNVSVSTIYRMAQEDVLPSSGRVNGRLRFERDAILQWWEDQKEAAR